jgi:hypothetical protein
MQHVFLLLVFIGTGEYRALNSSDMYFASIDRCNYFASQISKRYGNYSYSDFVDAKDRVTAYCIPKHIKIGSVEVY